MPAFDIRISGSDWTRLRKHCAPSFRGRQDTEIGVSRLGRSVCWESARQEEHFGS